MIFTDRHQKFQKKRILSTRCTKTDLNIEIYFSAIFDAIFIFLYCIIRKNTAIKNKNLEFEYLSLFCKNFLQKKHLKVFLDWKNYKFISAKGFLYFLNISMILLSKLIKNPFFLIKLKNTIYLSRVYKN